MGQKTPLKPLPPEKDFFETIKVLKQLSKASSALGELKGIAMTIPNQTMLINAIVLKEAKDSSEVENIITTQDELYQALSVNSTHNSQTKEVINYRKAIFEGFEIVKNQEIIRLRDIIYLQKIIIENNAGIRNTPDTVLKNDKTGEIVYTPPQDREDILDLLSNFLEHYNLNPTEIDLNPASKVRFLICCLM